jgi:serine/threonine-protein kinase
VLSGKYRVLGKLGKGGFGTVYTVQHVHTGKHFAAKVLHAEFAGNRRITERFWREAQTAALIEHENVVDIIDIGETPEGTLYFSMELLRGEPLADLLGREGALPWPRARGFALQIARALCAAHAKGVIHRDLKPANCLRITRGDNPDFVKVLDFGIAKIVHTADTDAPGLTSRGEVLGTPYYMAPEQAAGNVVDVRADVFSFGVLLFELLTGQLPFQGGSRFEILTKMMTVPPPPASAVARHGGLPPAIDALIAHALQPKPEQRPANMAELLAVLQGAERTIAIAAVAARPSADRQALGFAPTEAVPAPAGSAMESHSDLVATLPIAAKVEGRTELLKTTPQGKSAVAPRRRTAAGALAGLGVVGAALVAYQLSAERAPESEVSPKAPVIEPVAPPDPPTPAVAPKPEPAPPVVEPPRPEPPQPEPAPQSTSESVKPKGKATTLAKKATAAPPTTKKPPPPPPAPLVTCTEALELAIAKAPGLMTKCKGSTGITKGDRVTLSLAGNSSTRKLAVTIVQSSGSGEFDSCLATALERLQFPTPSDKPGCSKQFSNLKVP